jgi:hypothetical protein
MARASLDTQALLAQKPKRPALCCCWCGTACERGNRRRDRFANRGSPWLFVVEVQKPQLKQSRWPLRTGHESREFPLAPADQNSLTAPSARPRIVQAPTIVGREYQGPFPQQLDARHRLRLGCPSKHNLDGCSSGSVGPVSLSMCLIMKNPLSLVRRA